MARRTKEEALETRSCTSIRPSSVQREGVARTSLAGIADAAGVTRGAIYWHFRTRAIDYRHAGPRGRLWRR